MNGAEVSPSGNKGNSDVCVCVYWQWLGQPCGSVTPGRLCWELKQIERCGLLAKGPSLRTLAASIFTTLCNLSCSRCLHSNIPSTLSHSISFPHSYSETGHMHNGRAGKTRHDSRSYWLQNPEGCLCKETIHPTILSVLTHPHDVSSSYYFLSTIKRQCLRCSFL